MKFMAASILALQVIAFIILSVVVLIDFGIVVAGAGGFVPGFESIELKRLIATLAPYLFLLVSITLTVNLYRKKKYGTATWLPIILISLIFAVAQIYLKTVPDPIQDNFGARTSPYPGFLILPPEAVPSGFQERNHHYTKREYTLNFVRALDGKNINLDIIESDITNFSHNNEKLVQEFDYQGISGQIYSYHDNRTQEDSFNLTWLNPPKQRIAIYLTQTPDKEYSPETLIKILKSMKIASSAPPPLLASPSAPANASQLH